MSSLKRLVFVLTFAVALVLGLAPGAGAGAVAGQRGGTPADVSPAGAVDAQPPVFTPEPPPARPEDPKPDGGIPLWLWIVAGLLACVGVTVAVALWRGSRPPAGYVPVAEDTAELLAIGRQQAYRRPPPQRH